MKPLLQRPVLAALAAVGLLLTLTVPASPLAAAAEPRQLHSDGNPILGDGSSYSADAAPLVHDGTLYIYAGHDEAGPQQANFRMNDYHILATDDVDAGEWTHYPENMLPGEVFAWASGNGAYAGQVVEGDDDRFYWFAPVETEDASQPNRMAIGVAVSDTPTGPWVDAIGEPILDWADVFGSSTTGQEVIDPHVFRDDDGTWYLYWGSWNVARVVELTPELTGTVGEIRTMQGLNGFFEAPWVFKRGDTYYMAYDWKQGGSACTPSNYQACIAYATADNPLGPWSYQGIILGGTSATTVHPSIIEFDGKWYVTYHTKDAVGGGHFRRSVAIDEVTWDGDKILPVVQTWADDPAFQLTNNVALDAAASASFTETPPMRVGALNDGRAETALLPPDQWGNYRGTTSTVSSDWIAYQWTAPVRVDGAGVQFQRDGNWIRPPESWSMEYLDATGDWRPVDGATYPTDAGVWHDIDFEPVTTTALRATINGVPSGPYHHSVSVSEWEVYAATPTGYASVSIPTGIGEAPVLPEAVRLTFSDGEETWAPVNWLDVEPAQYSTEGTFTVQGRALGHDAALVSATVIVQTDPEVTSPDDQVAPEVSIAVLGSFGGDGWFSSPVQAVVRAEDDVNYRTVIASRVGDGEWQDTANARSVPVSVDTEGAITISGRATDAAGNTSAIVTREIRLDLTDPAVSATVDPVTRATTITASDKLSGLASVQYRVDDGKWTDVEPGDEIAAPDGLPHSLGYRVRDVAGNVTSGTVQIPLGDSSQLSGNVAPYASATATYTAPWNNVAGLNDGTAMPLEQAPGKLGSDWGTWPRGGEQVATLTWTFEVTVDQVGAWWFSDSSDTANAGMIPPRSWVLEYLAEDGVTWTQVRPTTGSEYTRERDTFNAMAFEPVTTTALRVVMQSWGAEEGQGSAGIRELQVMAAGVAPSPSPSPSVSASPSASPSESPTSTASPTATQMPTATQVPSPSISASPTTAPSTSGPVDVYSTPGFHSVNGRWWNTTCEPYSQTWRCRTDIWSTHIDYTNGRYTGTTGWHFNNLTYLPFLTEEQWASNPLGHTGQWTSTEGRRWKTECNTPQSGRNGCRSYIWSTTVTSTQKPDTTWSHTHTTGWVFNNIVRFRN